MRGIDGQIVDPASRYLDFENEPTPSICMNWL